MADVQVLARQNVDDTIRAVVRALVAYRAIKPEQVAAEIGISRGGFYKKLNSAGSAYPFKASEIYAMSKLFGLPVSAFFDGLAQLGESPAPNQDQSLAGPRHHLMSWHDDPNRRLTLVPSLPALVRDGRVASAA